MLKYEVVVDVAAVFDIVGDNMVVILVVRITVILHPKCDVLQFKSNQLDFQLSKLPTQGVHFFVFCFIFVLRQNNKIFSFASE